MIGKHIRMAAVTAVAVLLLAVGASGQEETLETGGKSFEDFLIAENDNFVMTASCTDEDPSDGYAWDVTFQNKGTSDYVIAVLNPALNNIMCDTDEWSVSGWTLKGGDTIKDAITWTPAELSRKGISDIGNVSFFLKVYKKGAYSGIAGVCIDEMVSVLLDQKALDAQKQPEEEQKIPPFLDNDACTLRFLSEDTDEDGMPVWHIVIENHTDRTEMYEIHDAVLNGWAIEPYWSQIVLPGCRAYSDISWWTLDADASSITGLETADFYIKTWRVQNGWTQGYSDETSYAASLPVTEENVAEAETETEGIPEEGESEAEPGTEPEAAAGSEAVSGEEETEALPSAKEDAAVSEERTFRDPEEGEERVFEDGTFQALLSQVEYDAEDAIGQADFFLENIADDPVLFAVERIRCGEEKIPAAWNSRLPGNSRRNARIYLDLSQLEDDTAAVEVTFTVKRVNQETPEKLVCVFDLAQEKLTEAYTGDDEPQEEAAEEAETGTEAEETAGEGEAEAAAQEAAEGTETEAAETVEGTENGAADETADAGETGAAADETTEEGDTGAAADETKEEGETGAAADETTEEGETGAAADETTEEGETGAAADETAEEGETDTAAEEETEPQTERTVYTD